jgi:hypothetical protein
VSKLAHAKTPSPLAALLTKDVSITKFTTPGDYHTWPAKWVEDSATEALAAYKGLEFGPASLKPDGKPHRDSHG